MPITLFARPLLTGILFLFFTELFAATPHFKQNLPADPVLTWEQLPQEPLLLALQGYWKLRQLNLIREYASLTLIDLSKPSNEERLFVINPVEKRVLLTSLVAHGSHSGMRYATRVSNTANSYQSSAGLYITLETYEGKNGYSLRLQGLQSGINDQAYARAIVIHGATYVDANHAKLTGQVGRSHGCPAVPMAIHKKLIDLIKDNCCLFIYHPSYPPTALDLVQKTQP